MPPPPLSTSRFRWITGPQVGRGRYCNRMERPSPLIRHHGAIVARTCRPAHARHYRHHRLRGLPFGPCGAAPPRIVRRAGHFHIPWPNAMARTPPCKASKRAKRPQAASTIAGGSAVKSRTPMTRRSKVREATCTAIATSRRSTCRRACRGRRRRHPDHVRSVARGRGRCSLSTRQGGKATSEIGSWGRGDSLHQVDQGREGSSVRGTPTHRMKGAAPFPSTATTKWCRMSGGKIRGMKRTTTLFSGLNEIGCEAGFCGQRELPCLGVLLPVALMPASSKEIRRRVGTWQSPGPF